MEVTSSYAVEVLHAGKGTFGPTIDYYRRAVSYLLPVVDAEWDTLSAIESSTTREHIVEHLIHTTKDNVAKYKDFDVLFYKMPSYLRRAAIRSALGAVSSYRSNYKNWIKDGRKGNPPRLGLIIA